MQQADWKNTSGIRVATFAGAAITEHLLQYLTPYFQLFETTSINGLNEYLQKQSLITLPEILLIEIDDEGECFSLVESIHSNIMLKGLIIVLLSRVANPQWFERVKQLKVHDYYVMPCSVEDVSTTPRRPYFIFTG